jgi:hypothetical protein
MYECTLMLKRGLGDSHRFRVVSGAITLSPRGIVDKSELRTGRLSEQPVFPPVAEDQWELLNERIGPINRKPRITTEAGPRSLADLPIPIREPDRETPRTSRRTRVPCLSHSLGRAHPLN